MRGFLKEHQVILAPMAGVSDVAFRQICIEQGAQLAYTEMVSAKGLSYANERTRSLLEVAPNEREVAVQLFGHEPDTLASQAARIEDELGERLAYIDINCGCPARKIVSKGDGSALMKDPQLAADIVSQVARAVSHPVTVKFRRGWAEGEETAPDFARRMEAAGAQALTVHGRYAQQMYRGSSCRETIARVVEAVEIPVIGNGDIRSSCDALDMLAETGCDAIMIARAAEGNPWIFSQVRAALSGEPAPPAPTLEERIAMARYHAELLASLEGRTIVRMRKHAQWYCSGLPGAAAARGRLSTCTTLDDFNQVFDDLLATAHAHANDAEAKIAAGPVGAGTACSDSPRFVEQSTGLFQSLRNSHSAPRPATHSDASSTPIAHQ